MTKTQHLLRHAPLLLSLVAVLLCAAPARAAELSFVTVPQEPAIGAPFTIEVYLSTEEDSINAAEGSVSLGSLEGVEVSTGGSVFTLWPVLPRYSRGTQSVEFAGGLAGSVAAQEKVKLFEVRAQAPVAGSYAVSLGAARAFKNDGRGTPVAIPGARASIQVVAEGEQELPAPARDVAPPEFVSVEVGQDASLFSGRKYVSFFAKDDESSISKFEVKEGWFGRYTEADRYYVLKDQEQGRDIWVRVTDAAGNTAVEKISSAHSNNAWMWIVGGILTLLAFIAVYRTLRKRRF